jgi:hypothetical protein
MAGFSSKEHREQFDKIPEGGGTPGATSDHAGSIQAQRATLKDADKHASNREAQTTEQLEKSGQLPESKNLLALLKKAEAKNLAVITDAKPQSPQDVLVKLKDSAGDGKTGGAKPSDQGKDQTEKYKTEVGEDGSKIERNKDGSVHKIEYKNGNSKEFAYGPDGKVAEIKSKDGEVWTKTPGTEDSWTVDRSKVKDRDPKKPDHYTAKMSVDVDDEGSLNWTLKDGPNKGKVRSVTTDGKYHGDEEAEEKAKGKHKPQAVPGDTEKPHPTGQDKPQPVVGDKPQPTGQDKPQPVVGDKPQPTGQDKPQAVIGEKPIPGKDQPGETKPEKPAEKGSPEADLKTQKDRFEHKVQELPKDQQERIRKYEKEFDARAKQMEDNYKKEIAHKHPELRGNQEEIAKQAHERAVKEMAGTYEATARLLEKKSTVPGVTDKVRADAAEQIMRHAGEPSKIDQGCYNTCALQGTESRLYNKAPAEVAKMISDVTLTGKYHTNGHPGYDVTIKPESIVPQGQSRNFPPTPDGQRDHASQIFAVTSANIYFENPAHHSSIRYEQHKPDDANGTTGEVLWDYSKNPPKGEEVKGPDGHFVRAPEDASTIDALVEINEQITGKHETGWAFEGPYGGSRDSYKAKSPEDLAAKMKQAIDNGDGPLVLRVHTGNQPFWGDSGHGAAGGSGGAGGGWHIVAIDGYTPSNQPGGQPDFKLNNQWGSFTDHPHTSATDLFRASVDAAVTLPTDGKQPPVIQYPGFRPVLPDLPVLPPLPKDVGFKDLQLHVDKLGQELHQNPEIDVAPHAVQLGETIGRLPKDEQDSILKQMKRVGIIDPGYNKPGLE